MEGLNNFSIILALIFASGVFLISPILTVAIDFGVSTPLQEPVSRPGLFKFLDECAKHITPACGKEIFDAVFGSGIVTDECCYLLLLMGKNCHYKFVNYIAHGPDFRARLLHYMVKSEKVHASCVSVAKSPAASGGFIEN
ncbi:hypothetical protein P3X46_025513 [Hevea brasiliensis]|uniref:Prolamin-like domain-containing protein n=1 Tax=Hevea brasiliensis TaxID=3981 RepID=A0ABQ9L959_HEVBR|nr:hypothetical protein P3X46_025513 [Hevea brasiliensis]